MNLVYNIYPLIPPQGKKILKNNFFMGNPTVDENFLLYQIIKNQGDGTSEIGRYLKTNEIKKFSLNKVPVYNLFTITSAIEYFFNNKSTIQQYSEEEFK
jgi:hypothetical protein